MKSSVNNGNLHKIARFIFLVLLSRLKFDHEIKKLSFDFQK